MVSTTTWPSAAGITLQGLNLLPDPEHQLKGGWLAGEGGNWGFLPFTFSLADKAFPKYQVTITGRTEQYTWFDKAPGENDHELVIVTPRLSSQIPNE